MGLTGDAGLGIEVALSQLVPDPDIFGIMNRFHETIATLLVLDGFHERMGELLPDRQRLALLLIHSTMGRAQDQTALDAREATERIRLETVEQGVAA